MAETLHHLSPIMLIVTTFLAVFVAATSSNPPSIDAQAIDSMHLSNRDIMFKYGPHNSEAKVRSLPYISEATPNVLARDEPADALAMVIAVQSTLSLLALKSTQLPGQEPQQTTTLAPSFRVPTPVLATLSDESLPSSTTSSTIGPSDSAVVNYLIPTPGDDNSFLPRVTRPDVAAVAIVAVVVVVILVAFFLPRKDPKQATAQIPPEARARYIVQPPEYARYVVDLEKGISGDETDKAREQLSTFKFPPSPSPAHRTGRDVAPSYSTQTF